jgi:hypothetical protein
MNNFIAVLRRLYEKMEMIPETLSEISESLRDVKNEIRTIADQGKADNRQDDAAQKISTLVHVPEPIRIEKDAYDQARDRRDKVKTIVEPAGVAIAIVLLIVNVCVMRATQRSSNTAVTTLIQQQRPWIRMEITPESGVINFDDHGAHLLMNIKAINGGLSPAIAVVDRFKFTHVTDDKTIKLLTKEPPKEVLDICNDAATDSRVIQAKSIFGNDKIEWDQELALDESQQRVTEKYIYTRLVGCIAYRADFTDRQFFTGAEWVVATASPVPGEKRTKIHVIDNGTVPVTIEMDILSGPYAR